MTLMRKCKECSETHKFEHIEIHLSTQNKDLIQILINIISRKDAIREIMNLVRDDGIREVWKMYSSTFVNKKSRVE